MSLQKEITIILLVVIGLFTGLDNAIQRFIIYPSYQKIDQERARKDMVHFRATLGREIHHVGQLVLDWAAWDDSYRFIQDGNKDYIKSNLPENLFESLEINTMHFVDRTGAVRWRRTSVPGHEGYVEVDHLPGDRFPLDDPLLQHEGLKSSISGVLITNHGALLIASRPVITSEGEGPIAGTLIFGKLLGDGLLQTLSDQGGVKLKAWPCDCESLDGDLPGAQNNDGCLFSGAEKLVEEDFQAFNRLVSQDAVVVREADDLVYSYSRYFGITGFHSLLLRAETPMEMAAIGKGALNGALLSILTGGLLILIVLREALKVWVLKPISVLTKHAVTLRNSETLDSRIADTINSRNEIGILAREFDLMVNRLGRARRHLVEQSYYSGMTEIASGVMHNIRNALTPVIAHIDLMREELKDLPIEEMMAAGHELTTYEVPEERRQMLVDFQQESHKYLEHMVADFNKRLIGMSDRIAAIERILADQEKFAFTDSGIERIELADLIKDARELLHLEYYRNLNIVLDTSFEDAGVIEGRRNALMHVITNLINNAVESIMAADRKEGGISVSAATEMVDGRNYVHIQVKDNGTGIEKENITRIFERGFSSKLTDTSGIGLHWCANTIASMQGRLYAESGGIGKGAVMHLLIPKKPLETL